MAVDRAGNVIRMTADNDTVTISKTGFRIAGVRLVAAAANSSAQLKATDTNGKILVGLICLANTVDEMCIPFRCDVETLHLDLSGAGAEVFVYLE
jgi:hypothetical protein